jgi:hypothetical protein
VHSLWLYGCSLPYRHPCDRAGGLVVATDDVLHFSYFLAVRAVHRLAGGAAARMAMLALPSAITAAMLLLPP